MNAHEVKSSKVSEAHSVRFRLYDCGPDSKIYYFLEGRLNQPVKCVYLQVVDYAEADPFIFLIDDRQ